MKSLIVFAMVTIFSQAALAKNIGLALNLEIEMDGVEMQVDTEALTKILDKKGYDLNSENPTLNLNISCEEEDSFFHDGIRCNASIQDKASKKVLSSKSGVTREATMLEMYDLDPSDITARAMKNAVKKLPKAKDL